MTNSDLSDFHIVLNLKVLKSSFVYNLIICTIFAARTDVFVDPMWICMTLMNLPWQINFL